MIRLKSMLVIVCLIYIFGLLILLLDDHGSLSLGFSYVKKVPTSAVSVNSKRNPLSSPRPDGDSKRKLPTKPVDKPLTTLPPKISSKRDPSFLPEVNSKGNPLSPRPDGDSKRKLPTKPVDKPLTTLPPKSTPAYQSTANGGKCLKNHFKDVLLVIIFNYAFYDTLPLILTNYEGVFARIVVCGPSNNSSYDIIVVEHKAGYYGYECVGKAVRLNPGLEGYFYVNDDMIVNWWNFAKFDKNKIWLGVGVVLKNCHKVGDRNSTKDWPWWYKESGVERCEKTYEELKRVADEKKGIKMNVKGMLSTALRNGKNEELCFKGWSDMFYVPARFSDRFQYLSEICFRNKLFLEICVPTMLSLLDLQKNWEKTAGTYLPKLYGKVDFVKGEHPWKVYSVDKTLFIHPVKYHAKTANVNREKYKTIVVPYGRKFLLC